MIRHEKYISENFFNTSSPGLVCRRHKFMIFNIPNLLEIWILNASMKIELNLFQKAIFLIKLACTNSLEKRCYNFNALNSLNSKKNP